MLARETLRRLRRSNATVIVILAALLWSHTATGNVRARPSLTAELGAPDADKTPLTIDRETLTFLVTAASTSVLYVIPSFAVSAGPTFRVTPEFHAGGRVDLSAIWPAIGGPTLAFDYFPGLETDDPRAFQVGLFWWVGF
ncbi:MAG: hypothetical protein ACQEVA_06670 [Myxococcota bacterium]